MPDSSTASSIWQSNTAASHWRSLWQLDPAVTFLNHGSFGACPIAVLEEQQQLRSRLEREPVRFFAEELEGLLDAARQTLAAFVGAVPDDLVFVPNATAGVNTVLRSLCQSPQPQLKAGDELLTTNHEYNACRNALNFAAEVSGATVVIAQVPYPIQAPEQVVDSVLARVSGRTKLVLLDHVTSQTALILPIQAIAQALSQQGIPLLVDGAHAPGMMPLNLQELGATYYTGNCHKWLCAPKGAAFLSVQPEQRSQLRPLSISHGANSPRCDRSRFQLEFDWTGTDDPTAYLCVPQAIAWMGSLLPGGWPELMAANHAKVLAARTLLSQALQLPLPAPEDMIGSMATLPLPAGSVETLYQELCDRQIQVPIVPWQGETNRLLRISAQLYNTLDDYERLANALDALSVSAALP